jgi:hypothetical protein
MPERAWIALCAGIAMLAACGRPDGGAAPRLDDRADPALISAINDPILIDPSLAQYSNRMSVRPAETPGAAIYPAGRAGPEPTGCQGALEQDAGWARRLPAAFFVMKGAQLRGGAGLAEKGCLVLVADFAVRQRPEQVVDFYWRQARAHGYSATQLARGRDQILFGGQGKSSYVLVVTETDAGAEAGLVFRSGD